MLEEIEFCYVPGGPFVMGCEEEMATSKAESPEHVCEIPYDYWMGRHPITTANFLVYVGASAASPGTGRLWPMQATNQPITNVSWYEAWAFCDWLTQQMSSRLPRGWVVRLPSEAEWEKAGRGGFLIPQTPLVQRLGVLAAEPMVALKANPFPRRHYPWGESLSPHRANYAESGHGTIMGVGSFPAGASPYGVEELSGNVWEWTRSVWGQDWDTPDYYYPYAMGDGREDQGASPRIQRVVRGGAAYVSATLIRCTTRHRSFPLDGERTVGFRVVVAPTDPKPTPPADAP